ncbi:MULTISPECIES: MocR-like pyridoxine biosynthesis transcription factor PdxR [unclassified Sphingomonas]|uniref:MocR-like pyridoxine biosynthesis transcription factor PdxR n=1 Tax=unclassified Sphingomonas TaxID=196159 RepID=UPI000B008BE3|nr:MULTISPECIES: PLP-dependent aminotransferase family protein [unclassified Sphingomonas]
MQLPIEVDRASSLSLQHQLMIKIRELILQRQLEPGRRLPSSRDLSSQLAVSRNTVIFAYDRLVSEGYLEVRERAGIFVSPHIPEKSLRIINARSHPETRAPLPSARILPMRNRSPLLYQRLRERLELDFRIGRPANDCFPKRLWTKLLVEKMGGSARRLTEYGNPSGLEELRVAIGEHLKVARGINAHPDQILIVAGSEEGLNIVAKILSPPGSTVYSENPCYKGVPYVFESYGATVVPIPVDEEGLCVDALLGKERGLVCVTPSHQFPVGVTMSLNRRLRLLDWADSNGTYIVEDDYDGDFRYDGSPLTALAGLDRSGSVIYVGTFSKSLGAGLRIGYLVVPEELVGAAREAKALLNNGNPWLEQAVLAEFIGSGGFERHLRKIRHTYLQRRNALLEQLRLRFGDVEISGEAAGMHLAWHLSDDRPDARTIQYQCLHRGVGVYSIDDSPAIDLSNAGLGKKMLFFGYACLTESEIVSAMDRLEKAALSLA